MENNKVKPRVPRNAKKHMSMIQFPHPRTSTLSSDSSEHEKDAKPKSFISNKYIILLSICAIVFCILAFKFLSNLSVINQIKEQSNVYKKTITESKKERKQLNGVSDSLETEVKQLEQQNKQLNKNEEKLKAEIMKLINKMDSLNNEIIQVQSNIIAQNVTINELSQKNNILENAIKNLNGRINAL
jgi:septal ring factor EnvC (AmiA/AmiB activator)